MEARGSGVSFTPPRSVLSMHVIVRASTRFPNLISSFLAGQEIVGRWVGVWRFERRVRELERFEMDW